MNSYLEVKCPNCNGMGTVTKDKDHFIFQCTVCGKRQKKEKTFYRYQISEMCDNCNRHFRLDIKDSDRQHFKILNVNCPYCNHPKQGTVEKISLNCTLEWSEIKNGIDPFFGFPLCYQTSFDGKAIWAYNREHLIWLIDYVEADTRGHVYHLPKFITLAKNRAQIAKLLNRLL